MSKTAGVSLHGNHYRVDPALVGYRAELRYDPEDLAAIEVFANGAPRGHATPERIGVHVDPKLRAAATPEPGPATGIAYLEAVAADHAAALGDQLSYQQPGLPLTDDGDDTDDGDRDDPTLPHTPGAQR